LATRAPYVNRITSSDFPATLGAFQSDLQNPDFVRGDAFVARIGEGLVIPPLDLFWQLVLYITVVILAGLIFYGRAIFRVLCTIASGLR